jgi:hypothetical protein
MASLTPVLFSGEGPLPEGDTGISAKFPLDIGIDKDPAVIFTDNFETGGLRDKWNHAVWNETSRLVTDDPANAHGGKRALEFTLPQGSTNGHGVTVRFARGYDTIFVRYYAKFDKDDDFYNSAHDGACLAAIADGVPFSSPGVRADGRNKFMASLDTWRLEDMKPVPTPPGEWIVYCYHPEQRGGYGDNFYPKPKFYVERDRWYGCELMLKANTVGQKDGRAAFWVDGKLTGDFPNLHLRDVDTLKINHLTLTLYIGRNKVRSNRMWYDDVVVATEYIGPLAKERKPPPTVSKPLTPPPPQPAAPVIDPKLLASWEEKLIQRVIQGAKDNERPQAYLKVAGPREEQVKVVAADAKTLTIQMQGNSLPVRWNRLSTGDRLALARAFLKEDALDDHLLVAVFALAHGSQELSDEHFARARAADPKQGAAKVAEVRAGLGLK